MEDTRLGNLLLETRIVSEEALRHCLELQSLAGAQRRPLGQILVEQGVIRESTLRELLELQKVRRASRFATLHVESGDVGRFLTAAVDLGASELVLAEGRRPVARVTGRFVLLADEPVEGPLVWEFIRGQMGLDVLERLASRQALTMPLQGGWSARGRISAFRHFDGTSVVVRLHPAAVRAPEAFDERVLQTVASRDGLLVVAAESGGGLTESMATLLWEAARVPGRSILVLDESFEYPLPGFSATSVGAAASRSGSDDSGDEPDDGARAMVVGRRIGDGGPSAAAALRAGLREGHDVLFVSECDAETLDIAAHAASSGRLVVAGFRAPSASACLRRTLRALPHAEQARTRRVLAANLRGVLAVQVVSGADARGATVATELLWFDDVARELLRSGALDRLQSLLRAVDRRNGHSMDADLVRLLAAQRIRFEEAFQFAFDKSTVLAHVESGRRSAAPGVEPTQEVTP